MISAGYNNPYGSQMMGGGYGTGGYPGMGGGYGMNPYGGGGYGMGGGYPGMMPGMQQQQSVGFTPLGAPAYNAMGPAPQIGVNANLSNTQMANYLDKQVNLQWGGMAANGLNQIGNQLLALYGMSKQADLAGKALDNNKAIMIGEGDKIGMLGVAGKQLEVQGKAIDAQKDMHAKQCDTEVDLMKLEVSLQKDIVKIQEKHKDIRAEMYVTRDTFKDMRTSYSYGDSLPNNVAQWS